MPVPLLIVDDDDDVRETFASVLREEGFEVFEAVHGRAALDALDQGLRPAAILLDQTMPVMSGREFRALQLQSSAYAHIPVLLMTASNAVAEIAGEIRPAAVVRKPCDYETLLAAVHQALANAVAPTSIALSTAPTVAILNSSLRQETP